MFDEACAATVGDMLVPYGPYIPDGLVEVVGHNNVASHLPNKLLSTVVDPCQRFKAAWAHC